MAALTDALVRRLRAAVMDSGAQPVLSFPVWQDIWTEAGEDYRSAVAIAYGRLALYHTACGNKELAALYARLAATEGAASGHGLGKLSVGTLSLNQNYPDDDDTSADRLDW